MHSLGEGGGSCHGLQLGSIANLCTHFHRVDKVPQAAVGLMSRMLNHWGKMNYEKEEVALPVSRYRDREGNPTCAVDFRSGEVCPYLMGSNFGTREHCFWDLKRSESRKYPLLKRRHGVTGPGDGTLIPQSKCPLWATSH